MKFNMNPSQILFVVTQREDCGETEPHLHIQDKEDFENEDIHNINHPDFDKFWFEESENDFSTEHFKNVEDARQWCLSIGMIEDLAILKEINGDYTDEEMEEHWKDVPGYWERLKEERDIFLKNKL